LERYQREFGNAYDNILEVSVRANAPTYSQAFQDSGYSTIMSIYQNSKVSDLSINNGILTFAKVTSSNSYQIFINDEEFYVGEYKDSFDLTHINSRFAGKNIKLSVIALANKDKYVNEVNYNDIIFNNSIPTSRTVSVMNVCKPMLSNTILSWNSVLYSAKYNILVNGQVIGETDQNIEKSDVNRDGNIDTLDVMYLNQVMNNKTWNIELTDEEATLEERLDDVEEDIVSGDEFTVNYVLTVADYAVNGISGILNYDSMMVELVSVEASNEWLGNGNASMFLYFGTESLTGTETEGENEEVVILPNEYVVVTATFRALMSGTTSISVETPEYFNDGSYLVVEEMEIATEVVINESDNNNLKYLTINGENILEEDVLDYEITVGNEVTTINVDAIPEIEGVTAISIISPEELAEGANTITITVVAENGDEKVYTITVIREEAPEEETTTQVNYNNYNEYNNNEEENTEVVTPEPEEEIEEEEIVTEEEESNLSRIIIIILILVVIAGLIYLIFKDEDDNETKKANKEINKLKKDSKDFSGKSNNNNSKNKNTKNKKK